MTTVSTSIPVGETATSQWIGNTLSLQPNQAYIIKAITSTGFSYELTASSTPNSEESLNLEWLGDGSDGPVTVSTPNLVLNDYASLTGNELQGDSVLTISDSTPFTSGDEILIIQVQNASAGIAGTYEFQTILSITGNDLTLSNALSNNYYSGSFDQVGATAAQVVRVPQYTSVTIESGSSVTATAWNGSIGGIIAFRATGLLTIQSGGCIDVAAKGYRGGRYGPSYNKDGFQGESYLGNGIGGVGYGVGKLNNAGGGGAYICGGGGEYGGGATNSDSWTGGGDTYARKGIMYGETDLSHLFFGSGGGGQWDGSDTYGPPSNGGNGGGIILIYANIIDAPVNGFVADGQSTSGIQKGSYTYGSSGGAGGSIYLCAQVITAEDNFCHAIGGLGNHTPTRVGGDGGVGRIRLDYVTYEGTTNPEPGYIGEP
jgi:hypothetical protein